MLLKCCSFSAGLTDGWSTAQINSGMKGMEAEALIWGCCRSRSQRWRDQSTERHYKWGKSWKQLRLSLGRKFLASFVPVSSLFFSFLPIFFFGWGGGGDYGTMHLPAEAAATRCYDLNTAAWRDDWLRGEAGVVEWGGWGLGWGGAAHPHPPYQ